MNFINKQNRTRIITNFGDNALQALFEITTIFGASDQRAHVERVDGAVRQHFRHALFDN